MTTITDGYEFTSIREIADLGKTAQRVQDDDRRYQIPGVNEGEGRWTWQELCQFIEAEGNATGEVSELMGWGKWRWVVRVQMSNPKTLHGREREGTYFVK